MIIRNQARCLKCGEHILSSYRHDFRTCSCGATSVDGGIDYIRRAGNNQDYENTSICIPIDVPTHIAAQYLGVLVAMTDNGAEPGVFRATTSIRSLMRYQKAEMPWFDVPNSRTLIKRLRSLVDWELVTEKKPANNKILWRCDAAMAPWYEN